MKSTCLHKNGGVNEEAACKINSNPYMIAFGILEILLSQIPDFDQLWWLSAVAAFMSFTYSVIGLALGIIKVAGMYYLTKSCCQTLTLVFMM